MWCFDVFAASKRISTVRVHEPVRVRVDYAELSIIYENARSITDRPSATVWQTGGHR